MKRFSIISSLLLLALTACAQPNPDELPTPSPDALQVRSVVEDFNRAIAANDVTALERVLHPEFRVVANRFPTPDATSILPRAVYLKLIADKTIGGTAYTITYHDTNVTKHSATVRATLRASESTMHVTFLIIKTPEGVWQIISDMAVME